MDSIASVCGQAPVGFLQGGWRFWEIVGHGGLGLDEVRGLQLFFKSNWGKFRVFLHGKWRLVLIQAMSFFLLHWGRKTGAVVRAQEWEI